jgi:DNA-binding PadR family transcriptional regulator
MPDDRTTLTTAALHILVAIGPGERHGYAIMTEVEQLTKGAVRLAPGTLYTTIKRLLAEGLIEESGERPDASLDDQRRRYYRLTPGGLAIVAAEVRRLEALVSTARPWALEAAVR